MRLSVIVPAFNSEHTIEKCLQAISTSDYHDYELIVVDDCSSDGTLKIAERYADTAIALPRHSERVKARQSGAERASGEIIVNVDSDVLIKTNALSLIADHFENNRNVMAITGMLSKECAATDFFSRYKNYYMYYIFKRLPEKISFLYGSIFAIRKSAIKSYVSIVKYGEDTELGQELIAKGHTIAFLKDLEVVHLKKIDFLKFIKNDFQIPFAWAKLFIKYQGWKQIGMNKIGFAHASKGQILSVILVPFIVVISTATLRLNAITLLLLIIWFLMNLSIFIFLTKEKGIIFGLKSVFVTFLDHLVMASGIFCGFLDTLIFSRYKCNQSNKT